MLQNLKQLVEESAQDAIIKNNEVPNEQNEAAIEATSGSIFDTLKEQLSSGNLGNLVDAFKGGNVQDSTIVQEASSSLTDKLGSMGINTDAAKGIAASIIPVIMGKLVNKTNDPNDSSFELNDILTKISGPDGKFQLSDLTDLFTSKNEAGTSSSGGIVDKLKGLFG